MSTPDEIAYALKDHNQRLMWDLHLENATTDGQSLLLIYSHSQSKYNVSHTFFQYGQGYYAHEQVKINNGATEHCRIFVIEEIKNKPQYVRLTLYQEKLHSLKEA